MRIILVLLTLGFLAGAKKRLKILVSVPGVSYSHLQFQGALADLLVDAGHEVHFFITEMNPLAADFNGSEKAHRIIRFKGSADVAKSILSVNHFRNPFSGANNMILDRSYEQGQRLIARFCEDLLNSEDTLNALRSEHYDLVVAEVVEPCMFGVARAFGIPTTIATVPVPMIGQVARYLGIPSPASFVPNLMAATVSGDRMPYYDRARNLFMNLYDWWYNDDLWQRIVDPLFAAKFGAEFPSMDRLLADASLVFVNSKPFFDLSRPLSHKVIHIGGVAEKAPKRLSKEFEDVFAKSATGVVLFSFGSLADTTKMSLAMKKAFLNAFAKLPEIDFIWKFTKSEEDEELFKQYPNVHAFKWMDQVSILAHPKTRVFITHAGLNSVNEASAHGVPMITIPLFGDQLYNAGIVKKLGVGIHLNVLDISETMVSATLKTILEDKGYSLKAQMVKRKLQAEPFKPAEKFVKWVEFAAEFHDLSELGLAGSEMNSFVYHSLDVILPIIALTLTVIALLYCLIARVIRLVLLFTDRKKKNE